MMDNDLEDTSSAHQKTRVMMHHKETGRRYVPVKYAITHLVGGTGAEDSVHDGYLVRIPLFEGGGFALAPRRSSKHMVICQADGTVEKWVFTTDNEQELITRWWFPEETMPPLQCPTELLPVL